MIDQDLKKNIFWDPLKNGANELLIVSGYATPNMASWLMKNLKNHSTRKVSIQLIIGMVPQDGLSISVHEGFKELVTQELPDKVEKFVCSYVFENKAVHSKVYIWLKDGMPIKAFNGSANFTQSSFGADRREVMTECDPVEAKLYFDELEADTIYCNHAEVEEYIVLRATHPVLDMENRPKKKLEGSGIESVVLTLLDSDTGETHEKAGLNWGHRKNKYHLKDGTIKYSDRNKNEAYIPCPAEVVRSGFFPLEKQHFTVFTDDQHQLILRAEQANYKALTTPLSNAQLGEYFRNRLGLANGAYVTKADLEAYGRTDVTFYKLDDEQFFMDFSVE